MPVLEVSKEEMSESMSEENNNIVGENEEAQNNGEKITLDLEISADDIIEIDSWENDNADGNDELGKT